MLTAVAGNCSKRTGVTLVPLTSSERSWRQHVDRLTKAASVSAAQRYRSNTSRPCKTAVAPRTPTSVTAVPAKRNSTSVLRSDCKYLLMGKITRRRQ
jgi:hypothetical protein